METKSKECRELPVFDVMLAKVHSPRLHSPSHCWSLLLEAASEDEV